MIKHTRTFVGLAGLTEAGEPIYLINPKKTTLKKEEAFTWNSLIEANSDLREARISYKTDAVAIEILNMHKTPNKGFSVLDTTIHEKEQESA